METPFAHSYPATHTQRYHRVAHVVSLIGPAIAAAGVIWGILQPYRLTLLHPRGESVWWLLIEPPLLVVVVGLLFSVLVARPLLADLEAHDAAAR